MLVYLLFFGKVFFKVNAERGYPKHSQLTILAFSYIEKYLIYGDSLGC